MMEWLMYLLEVSACTVLFFAVYLLVLKKLTFFKFNRFYLLGSLFLSFIIPALQFEVKREVQVVEMTKLNDAPLIAPVNNQPFQMVQPLAVEHEPQQITEIDWNKIGFYGYLSITVMLLLVCAWRLFALLKYAKSFKQIDGLKLISKTEGFTNCSFFNYVFINDQLSENELQVLLTHESVHAKHYHSVDKILLILFKTVLWFNPVIYLFDKAVEQNHEYEADEITSSSCGSQVYANLLLRLAVAKNDMPLIHNFVKSPIKDRIKMLFNSKSKNMKKLTYLLALPVVFGLVWLFAVEVVYAQSVSEKDVSSQDSSKNKVSKYHELPLPNVKQANPCSNLKEYSTMKATSKVAIGKTLTGIAKQVVTQKVAGLKPDTSKKAVVPKIISFTKLNVDKRNNISKMDGAVINIGSNVLRGEQVEIRRSENLIIATKASVEKDGVMVIADKIIYDLYRGIYKTYNTEDNSITEYGATTLPQEILMKRISYSAVDSVKFSKDKKVIKLYGNAKLANGDVNLIADEIIYDSVTRKGTAKNVKIKTLKSGVLIDGSDARFDLTNTGKFEVWPADN